VLAVVYNEVGWEEALDALQDAVISAVNVAEVQAKLVGNGMPPEIAWKATMKVVPAIEIFDEAQSRIAGDLILKTREYGLSLGDRACLALAIVLDVPVYTADRIWTHLNVGIEVRTIR
jgi:ribonuclease VapC